VLPKSPTGQAIGYVLPRWEGLVRYCERGNREQEVFPERNTMKAAVAFLLLVSVAQAQDLTSNMPYADPAHERQVLDVYAPDDAKNLPVVFWIRGGGWQTGDKTSVQIKPRVVLCKGRIHVESRKGMRGSSGSSVRGAAIPRGTGSSSLWCGLRPPNPWHIDSRSRAPIQRSLIDSLLMNSRPQFDLVAE
jgi:hypothetical protein